MASKKNKNVDVKSKSKLKKRKLEKHKRKQLEKKFLHRNKNTVMAISIIGLLAIVTFSGYSLYDASQEAKSIVELGDEVKFNFISYFDNGDVIQHTIVTTPNDVTVDTDLSGNQLKNPQKLVIGGYGTVDGILIPLYWNDGLFVGQKKGDTFYLSIPAEDVYGTANNPIVDEERVFNVSRYGEADRYSSMGIEEFEEEYGEPSVGLELEIGDESVAVTAIDELEVHYELLYGVDDEIYLEYGKATVTGITDEKIEAFYEGETDVTFYAQVGDVWLPVHVSEVLEDELVLEVDHYNYKILIDSIDKNVIDQDDWSISDGDFAIVRYIGYYEDGEVFDSSIIDDVELEIDLPLDNTFDHSPLYITVKPGTTISGTSTVIDGFNEAMKGMVAGEEKVIEVPPEEGYGLYDDTLVEDVYFLIGEFDTTEQVQKTTTMDAEAYLEEYGTQPLVGGYMTLAYGTLVITDVGDVVTFELAEVADTEFIYNNVKAAVVAEDDETITIEYYPVDGAYVAIVGGDTAKVHVDGDTFRVEYDPTDFDVGATFASGKITEIGEDHFVVDSNHPMAGKTLYFKIRIVDFRKVSD